MTCSLMKSVVAVGCIVGLAQAAAAETKVTLSKTHVCCPQCVKAIAKVLEDTNAKGEANQKEGTVTFTAADDAAAQKTVDALAAAGFHGTTDSDKVKVKDDSGVKEGKVASLKLKGIHNCCGQCNNAIKATLKKIEGVESDDAKAKSETLTITGNFDAKAVVKALNDAGFHVTAEK
jgi:mercuric ion binding protein